MLQDRAPGDWLMWRRTLNGWGDSPLDQIDRDNVDDLRMVRTRALAPGSQEGTLLAYGGMLYMPNPNDHLQAIDAVTGDLVWEYRRELPDDLLEVLGGLVDVDRNVAIYGDVIIDTGNDDYVYALDAVTGELAWETQIFDCESMPTRYTSGPIVANGKVVSGRSCRPRGGPDTCVIVAHDATTGAEVWRTRLVPAPGEPGDETWGGGPFEERVHVGSWMVPSYDPLRNSCARVLSTMEGGLAICRLAARFQLAPGTDQLGIVRAISVETGETVWIHEQRAGTMSLVATGGGLVFGGDVNGRFRALDQETGDVVWEINLGSPVTGFPITYAVDGRQYVAVSTGKGNPQARNLLEVIGHLQRTEGLHVQGSLKAAS